MDTTNFFEKDFNSQKFIFSGKKNCFSKSKSWSDHLKIIDLLNSTQSNFNKNFQSDNDSYLNNYYNLNGENILKECDLNNKLNKEENLEKQNNQNLNDAKSMKNLDVNEKSFYLQDQKIQNDNQLIKTNSFFNLEKSIKNKSIKDLKNNLTTNYQPNKQFENSDCCSSNDSDDSNFDNLNKIQIILKQIEQINSDIKRKKNSLEKNKLSTSNDFDENLFEFKNNFSNKMSFNNLDKTQNKKLSHKPTNKSISFGTIKNKLDFKHYNGHSDSDSEKQMKGFFVFNRKSQKKKLSNSKEHSFYKINFDKTNCSNSKCVDNSSKLQQLTKKLAYNKDKLYKKTDNLSCDAKSEDTDKFSETDNSEQDNSEQDNSEHDVYNDCENDNNNFKANFKTKSYNIFKNISYDVYRNKKINKINQQFKKQLNSIHSSEQEMSSFSSNENMHKNENKKKIFRNSFYDRKLIKKKLNKTENKQKKIFNKKSILFTLKRHKSLPQLDPCCFNKNNDQFMLKQIELNSKNFLPINLSSASSKKFFSLPRSLFLNSSKNLSNNNLYDSSQKSLDSFIKNSSKSEKLKSFFKNKTNDSNDCLDRLNSSSKINKLFRQNSFFASDNDETNEKTKLIKPSLLTLPDLVSNNLNSIESSLINLKKNDLNLKNQTDSGFNLNKLNSINELDNLCFTNKIEKQNFTFRIKNTNAVNRIKNKLQPLLNGNHRFSRNSCQSSFSSADSGHTSVPSSISLSSNNLARSFSFDESQTPTPDLIYTRINKTDHATGSLSSNSTSNTDTFFNNINNEKTENSNKDYCQSTVTSIQNRKFNTELNKIEPKKLVLMDKNKMITRSEDSNQSKLDCLKISPAYETLPVSQKRNNSINSTPLYNKTDCCFYNYKTENTNNNSIIINKSVNKEKSENFETNNLNKTKLLYLTNTSCLIDKPLSNFSNLNQSNFNGIKLTIEDKRTLAVTEVYNTEKSYVESLKILVNNYMQPLKTSNLVERNLVDEIFYQIPEILKHHEHFLMLLQARLDNWDVNQNIGDVFREIFTRQPIIDTYIAFINNWKNANEAIRSACQVKPNFLKFLELKSREQKNKYSLDDYLIMPVQRIPRYELLIKDLLKYTNVEHSDYKLLKLAQQDIHEIAVNINNIEKETAQVEKDMQQLKEIEMCIEGTIDLVQPDRKFVHYENAIVYDSVQNVKKDRYLFLFNDLLIVTSLKKKTTANKKILSSKSNSPFNTLDGNKHKCVQKFLIKNIFLAKKNEQTLKKNKKEIETLKEDQEILNRIIELTKNLNCNHLQLDEQLNSVKNSVNKHLMEKNNQENFLSSLDLFVQTTPDTFETYELIFNNVERKTIFETKFNQLKKLLSGNDTITPYFLREIALPKTRAGLLFSCATATLPFKINSIENLPSNLDNYSFNIEKTSKNLISKNPFNTTINQQITSSSNLNLNQNSNIINTFKQNNLSENDQYGLDVWICNSDGYVGQVCVLSLNTEPTVTSCNGVCNSRILCIVAVPAYRQSVLTKNFDNLSNLKNEDDYDKSINELKQLNETKNLFEKTINSEVNQSLNKEDKVLENDKPTMWLGTEDKMIHIYNCNDNIRMKKNKIKISLCSSVNTIVYLDNKVYAGLNSGELVIFSRDDAGKWLTSDFLKLQINNKPIVKIIACHKFLWIAYGNEVAVYETENCIKYHNTIKVSTDSSKTIQCMTSSDYSIWIATTRSSQVRLYHAISMQFLLEINVSATVNRLLNVLNDNIIKQHKSACLRVTTLLACKQTLWIGTTAGIVCTLTAPSVDEFTQQVSNSIKINNVSHGHTGHVRFLTAIELNSATSEFNLSKFTGSSNTTQQQQLEKQLIKGQNYLIISGGDGFENFSSLHNNNSNEGKGDSTNHLLLWVI